MASPAQALANRSNAQHSTGPQSEAGKINSARNSFSHGLNATSENLFAHMPEAKEEFEAFRARLEAQMKPAGELELLAFARYAFSRFQAGRACHYEVEAERAMAADFGNLELERRWMRFVQTRVRLNRESDAALRAFNALQVPRLAKQDRDEYRESTLAAAVSLAQETARHQSKPGKKNEPNFDAFFPNISSMSSLQWNLEGTQASEFELVAAID